jgi:hypothetical protein
MTGIPTDSPDADAVAPHAAAIPAAHGADPRAKRGERTSRSFRMAMGVCGIVGPLLLAAYFNVGTLVALPAPSAPAAHIAAFATAHETLLLLAGWLLGTGTLVSLVFYLGLVHLARAATRLAGLATIVGAAAVLALSLTEALLLMATPLAAADHHAGLAATTWYLVTGSQAFLHVFLLAPAPLVLLGLGELLRSSRLLPRWLAVAALALGAAFLVAGLAVQLAPGAVLVPVVVLQSLQEVWTLAAAITFLVRPPASTTASAAAALLPQVGAYSPRVADVRCFGCSALVPDRHGPVHKYMLSAPGCWAMYGSVLAWCADSGLTAADPTTAQRMVDAYAVQHATNRDRRNRQSVAVHLMSLCAALEHGSVARGCGRSSPAGPIVTTRNSFPGRVFTASLSAMSPTPPSAAVRPASETGRTRRGEPGQPTMKRSASGLPRNSGAGMTTRPHGSYISSTSMPFFDRSGSVHDARSKQQGRRLPDRSFEMPTSTRRSRV